jgi:selenocysteine lyase/cysteine desulfurase
VNGEGSVAPRGDFTALERYCYLNSASISLVPGPVQSMSERFARDIAAAGTVSLDEDAESRALEEPRSLAARLLGARLEDVVIVTNATEGICQLAWAIRPTKGTNVVSIDIEFPSVVYPWVRVAQDTGAEIRLVRAMDDPAKLTFEALEEAVDNRTAVICISHVQYATGHRFDLRALARLAHRHGALCVVDATQSAGIAPIDAETSGVDALVTAGYKWLCGPFGAAVLYVRADLRERLTPPIVGWRSTDNFFNFDATRLEYARDARKFESGTIHYPSAFGLGESIRYLLEIGVDRALAHTLNLCDRLRSGLLEMGAEVLTPAPAESRAGIMTARFPGRDGEAVARELNRRGIIVSPRFGATRFSPHVFNNLEDVERALAETKMVLDAVSA